MAVDCRDWKAVADAVIDEHERRKAEQVKLDPYHEARKAFMDGKLQTKGPDSERWIDWDLSESPRFNCPPEEYRRKPEWKLPEPPEGEQWHRTDWTEDMLPDGYRPLLRGEVENPEVDTFYYDGQFYSYPSSDNAGARRSDYHRRTTRPLPFKPEPFAVEKAAFEQGKTIQFYSELSEKWLDCTPGPPSWYPGGKYRVKPEPVMVDLGPDDVPIGAEFRRGKDRHSYSVISERGVTLSLCKEVTFTWADLFHCGWEINRNDGLGWVPCSKDVTP